MVFSEDLENYTGISWLRIYSKGLMFAHLSGDCRQGSLELRSSDGELSQAVLLIQCMTLGKSLKPKFSSVCELWLTQFWSAQVENPGV